MEKDSVITGKYEVKHVRKGDKLDVLIAKQTEIDDCNNSFLVSEKKDSISSIADLNDLEEHSVVWEKFGMKSFRHQNGILKSRPFCLQYS